MSKHIKYFTLSDAWVLSCIFGAIEDEGEISLTDLIARGDMLNHAILMLSELKEAFYKGQKKGLIKVKDKTVILSKQAIEIREKIENGRGGLFSMVGNLQKRLNSPRLKLKEIEEKDINKCDFLTEDNLNKAYQKYKKKNF